jgi:hypothetical protein
MGDFEPFASNHQKAANTMTMDGRGVWALEKQKATWSSSTQASLNTSYAAVPHQQISNA